jgi:hypothetical protein
MTEKLTYEELNFPTFVNTHTALALNVHTLQGESKIIELPLSDAIKASVLAGCSFLNIGDTRCGKSQVMMDIHRNYFGGDADLGGKSNWHVARNDFSAEGYFMTLDQSKIGEGKGMLSKARVPIADRITAMVNGIDEINLALPEVQVEFFGIAEGRHKGIELGRNGYHLFMSSCNMNRINGDFSGTSQINRALLNRFGATFDFDYYRRTDADDDTLAQREVSGRLNLAPARDISDKILAAYTDIRQAAAHREPSLDAYIRFFSSGLDYCNKDALDKRKKKIWPTLCTNCDFRDQNNEKGLCSLVKQSNTGTTGMLKRFALGINYLVQLKHGEVIVDLFELALESFKFTTYHGNLNGMEVLSTYSGEDQEQMRDVVQRTRATISPLKPYIDRAIEKATEGIEETRFIRLQVGGETHEKIYSEADKSGLDALSPKPTYEVFDPFTDKVDGKTFAERTGIRVDWFPGYLKKLAQHYRESKK